MGTVSDDAEEGLGLSVATYLAAIGASITVLSTGAYFITGPTRLENPGIAAYKAPRGAGLTVGSGHDDGDRDREKTVIKKDRDYEGNVDKKVVIKNDRD